jgi:DHA2 family multidrug resistance protein-like MFS transporter
MDGTIPSPRSRWLALATLNLAVLLVAVDATVLNLALPALAADLDPSATQTLWILDVYSLVLAGLLVPAGTLSDRLGRRRVLLAGCALFGVASVLAAFAPSAEALIAARVLLAVGGATIMPSTLALIRAIFTTPRERTLAIGLWSAMAAAGAAVGPVLGGVLLESFWWGSVFLINVPVMVVLLVAGRALLPEVRDPAPGTWDVPSVGASIVGLVALVAAVKEAAKDGVGLAPAALALLAVAALTWFVRRQGRLATPLIDVTLFRRPSFTGAVLGTLFALLALSGLLLFVSQYLQLVLGHGPLEAGLRLLPLTLGALVGAPLTARLVHAVGVRATVTAGLLLSAGGMVGFGLSLDAAYGLVAAALATVGAGVGLALTATSDAILTAVPPERAGAASSISETAYELGTGLGIAVLGSLLTALYADGLPASGVAAPVRDSLAGAVEAARTLPGEAGAGLLDRATDAFVDALTTTSWVSAGLLCAAAAVAFALLGRTGRSGARAGAPAHA